MSETCTDGNVHQWTVDSNQCERCGRIRLYHRTSRSNAESILQSGVGRADIDFADWPIEDGNVFEEGVPDSWIVVDVEPADIQPRRDGEDALVPSGKPIIQWVRDGENYTCYSSTEIEFVNRRWIQQVFSDAKPDSLTRARREAE